MGTLKKLETVIIPDLYEWQPDSESIFYRFDGENVIADYETRVGRLENMSDLNMGRLEDISTIQTFYIKKSHYKTRMNDIVHHMNYFTKFYDIDRETFFSIMSVKYLIDKDLDMPQKDFVNLVIDRIVTPKFIGKCKLMACSLYKLNINADTSGKYNNTPKITNRQALQIVSVSFCFKILIPIILHFVAINHNFDDKAKTEYIKWFNRIFNKSIKKFEENDTPFFISLCNFVKFRGEKLYRNNQPLFYQKKMLRGDTLELFNEDLIKEVVCVKTLYKLDYRKSCVAFIDGVVHNFNQNYTKEKYVAKPYEIDSVDTQKKDSDESLSHAEALEMQNYKRDESAAMIADVNSDFVVSQLKEWYAAFNISEEEFIFYSQNYYPSPLSRYFFENFYAAKFKDPFATININRADTIYLLICMKKIFERNKMHYLAQICTAQVYEKYKKNMAKDLRSTESFVASPVYKEIISKKFSYLMELPVKDNPILNTRLDLINSSYVLVDFDEKINGYKIEHVDDAAVSDEYLSFLAMI